MGMIERGGLDALSLHKLAAEVDYTPGALYRYFGSKGSLLSTLLRVILDDLRRHLEVGVAGLPEGTSPLARVFALVLAYRVFARREPQRFGLLAMSMAEPRVLVQESEDAASLVETMTSVMKALSDALASSAASGALEEGDAGERTLCLFALVQGVLQLHKQSRYAPALLDLDRLVVRGVGALLVGWGARLESVEQAIAQVGSSGGKPSAKGEQP